MVYAALCNPGRISLLQLLSLPAVVVAAAPACRDTTPAGGTCCHMCEEWSCLLVFVYHQVVYCLVTVASPEVVLA